ncbi:MAG: hypothetical protein HFH75_12025 [Lachnospiraceae bacterium]|nr:hypothetical protein [Lachnospiraceae bacterium]
MILTKDRTKVRQRLDFGGLLFYDYDRVCPQTVRKTGLADSDERTGWDVWESV